MVLTGNGYRAQEIRKGLLNRVFTVVRGTLGESQKAAIIIHPPNGTSGGKMSSKQRDGMGHRKENTSLELWLQIQEHFLCCCLCGQGKTSYGMLLNLASHWQTHL